MMGVLAVFLTSISCQKPSEQFGEQLFQSSDRHENTVLSAICYEVLPAVISANRVLDADSAYLISGVVRVTGGATLTAPAGTVFLGDHNVNSKGFLVIEPGSKLDATGTCGDPVVFTSFAAPNSRAPGDWGGLFILGKAKNNLTSEIMAVTIGGSSFTAGNTGTGTNDTDDSGILHYVQIHYAGYQPGSDTDPSALLLASVGDGTDIQNIQLTNTLNDGIRMRGGKAKIDYLFNLDVQNRDFVITHGNRSEMQFVAAVRKTSVSTAGNGYGLDISSDGSTDILTAPYTNPTISNLTLLGPDYFGVSTTNYENAIRIYNNGAAKIYNSVLTQYSPLAPGLFIDGNAAIANTASGTNPLEFAYNSFFGFATNFGAQPDPTFTWSTATGCDLSMANWLGVGTGTFLCVQAGNQISVSSFAMHSSVLGNYCSSFPNYVLASNTLDDANFEDWDATGFTAVEYRGAFPPSGSWVDSCWMNLCPQQTNYCI